TRFSRDWSSDVCSSDLKYEDRTFRWHPGVNPFALLRAGWQWLRNGHIVSGGSTITMQVARIVDPRSRTVGGKLTQIARAFQIERSEERRVGKECRSRQW